MRYRALLECGSRSSIECWIVSRRAGEGGTARESASWSGRSSIEYSTGDGAVDRLSSTLRRRGR